MVPVSERSGWGCVVVNENEKRLPGEGSRNPIRCLDCNNPVGQRSDAFRFGTRRHERVVRVGQEHRAGFNRKAQRSSSAKCLAEYVPVLAADVLESAAHWAKYSRVCQDYWDELHERRHIAFVCGPFPCR